MEQNSSSDPEQSATEPSGNPLKTLIHCALLAVTATMLLFFLPWGVIGGGIWGVLSVLWGAIGTGAAYTFAGLHAISKPLAAVAIAAGLTGACFIHKSGNRRHSGWAVLVVGLSLLTLALVSMSLVTARATNNILSAHDRYPTSHELLHSLTPGQAVRLHTIWKETKSWETDRSQTRKLLGSRVDSMGNLEFRWFRRALNNSSRGGEQRLIRPGCEKFVRALRESEISPYTVLTINGEVVAREGASSPCRIDRLNVVRAKLDFPDQE